MHENDTRGLAVQPERERDITKEMAALGSAAETCAQLVEELGRRLAPFMRDEPEKSSGDPQDGAEPQERIAPFAGWMRSSRLVMEKTAKRAGDMIERLEV